VNFDEAVRHLDGFEGQEVEPSVWGLEEDAGCVAFLVGRLQRLPSSEEFESVGVQSTAFQIGEESGNQLVLWPQRFVRAEEVEHPRGEKIVEIVTADASFLVGRKSRPWID
jgi:hypothetical protein